MPQRITPEHDFGPCTMNRRSIEQIGAALSSAGFAYVKYEARDGVWEVYDEPLESFLAAIAGKKRLDRFEANAYGDAVDHWLQLSFTASEATLRCNIAPSFQDKLEHLIHDVRKALLPPTLFQRVALLGREGRWSAAASILSAVSRLSIDYILSPSNGPYVRIILEKEPPNPLWENIKANLISNIIWAVIGGIVVFVAQWIAKQFGLVPFWR